MLTTPVERRLGFFFLEMASWVPSGLSPSAAAKRDKVFLLHIFFGGLECVGHFFAYVAHFLVLR
jgi:hypothetical protein